MGVQSTVVFADLFGSTGVFESLGNAAATEAVTKVTSWVAQKIAAHDGKVVKFLGDGVLATFKNSAKAIGAVIDVQRAYQQLLAEVSTAAFMPLRIGVARGEVETKDEDCYGDAVNLAARLSELTGPHQIWVNSDAIEDSKPTPDARFRFLGPIHIRGRSEPCEVYQVEWQEDIDSDFFTMLAGFEAPANGNATDVLGGQVELTWRDTHKMFHAFELPVHIGRNPHVQFVVDDARVSRTHARVDWRNGSVVLADVSSYGCWVRFSGGGADLMLRREECVLHGHGEISLGAPFSDLSAPVVAFTAL